MVIFDLIIFVVTLAILIKSSDFFVDAAEKIAKYLNISGYVIGFTLVAIGTSLPELVSSIAASYFNSPDLIIGNIIGSNIANIGLILGMAALIGIINVEKRVFYKEGLFLIGISVLFFFFAINNLLSIWEALAFLALFVAYSLYVIQFNIFKTLYSTILLTWDFIEYKILRIPKKEEIKEEAKIEEVKAKKPLFAIFKQLLIIIISGAAMIFSVEFLIPSAKSLALGLGVSETIVGISMLAVGTSLPELMVAISSVKKGLGDLLVGTIIGSNISNILLVGGAAALINPIPIAKIAVYFLIPSMLILTLALLAFIRAHWVLRMFQGLILLLFYLLFIFSLFFIGS